MRFLLLLLFACTQLWAANYDCAIIGTSPVSLFEALYNHYSGKKVLILEAAAECGGAWKSIDICGVPHVDMGCHEISSTPELNLFLEEYAGCRMISTNKNFYFSQGCFELIDNLLHRIEMEGIPLITECKVESVCLDIEQNEALLKTPKGVFTTSKIIVTPGSSFNIENMPNSSAASPRKFYHLYLLIQDPTPPRFSYHTGVVAGVSRMMNLTPFVDLQNTERQLIVLQTYTEQSFVNSQNIFDQLQKAHLINPEAFLLRSESYVYEQHPPFRFHQLAPPFQNFFEQLNTSHFNVIQNYAAKWKKVLTPYVQNR